MATLGALKKPRTSKAQFSIYLEYLKKHPILITGKLTPTTGPENILKIWSELKDALNSCGDGPVKDIDGWKKVFTEWKSQVRKKARLEKTLNSLEEKLLSLTGAVVVKGISEVSELGTEIIDSPENAEMKSESVSNEIINDPKIFDSHGNQEEYLLSDAQFEILEAPQKEIPKKVASKKKSVGRMSNRLLDAYRNDQLAQKEGLMAVAEGLHAIAASINKLCDAIEKLCTYVVSLDVGRIRAIKTTSEQYGLYLQCLEKFKYLKTIPQHDFVTLCELLNKCKGPTKSVTEWKQVFTEWTSKIKTKARNIYNHRLQTGGGGPINLILTDLEEKLLSLTGAVVVKGISEVSELGTEIIDSPENAEMKSESVSNEIINDPKIFDSHGNQEEYLLSDAQFEILEAPQKEIPKKVASKKKSVGRMSNRLLDAYRNDQLAQKEGLMAVAEGLHAIAASINKLCDAIEKLCTYVVSLDVGRIRAIKTTSEQYGLYLQCLEKFKYLKTIPQHDFVTLCELLNKCKGPTKSVTEWKQVFTEWTSKIKTKARNIYNHRLQTGGGGPINLILTDLEEKLLSLTGAVVVKGISEVSELGTEIIDSPENAEMKSESVSNEIINDPKIFDSHGNQEEYLLSDAQFEILEAPQKEIPKKVASKKKSVGRMSNRLLDAYRNDQLAQKEGLMAVAEGLHAIAASINKLCDAIEKC
ncbi:hypothetical protein FQR65_LT15459 [Abscondita terminalis]|nr:hypothetical protein FQR65_LT15459 [Abscondita terminalis]